MPLPRTQPKPRGHFAVWGKRKIWQNVEIVISFSGYSWHKAMCVYARQRKQNLSWNWFLEWRTRGRFYPHAVVYQWQWGGTSVHTRAHIQWFHEPPDWAMISMLNMLKVVPKATLVKHQYGSLRWQVSQFSHTEPSKTCLTYHFSWMLAFPSHLSISVVLVI